MTLVVDKGLPEDQPQLHALVVGVAHYPHLVGGGGALHDTPPMLSQVSTPEHTALRVAEWLEKDYSNPKVPLGTIEILVSSPAQDPNIGAATMANLDKAWHSWRKRCNHNPENILLFYFCGHGVSNGQQYLLLEDFAHPDRGLWENALNFSGSSTALRSCAADTQLFFVDACREPERTLISTVNPGARQFGSANFNDSVSSQTIYYAASEGSKAYGPTNGETYFCQALLKCLSGAGSNFQDDAWWVDTDSLGTSLRRVLEVVGDDARISNPKLPNLLSRLDADGSSANFHQPKSPQVLVRIDCDPSEAREESEIRMNRDDEEPLVSPRGEQRPWSAEVTPGEWDLKISFETFSPAPFPRQILHPPIFSKRVSAQK